mmetsp:Transcript_9278/g.23019  ORF Transcript_9278/g.23019 Transcript_9278/m.23019 type:complete len:368 (+) Transcript_9278:1508-2611(+)
MTANSTEYKTLNEASNVASSFGKGWWLERTYLFVCLKVCSEVGVKHGELDLNWPAGGWLVRKPPLLRRAPLLDAHGDRQAVLDAVHVLRLPALRQPVREPVGSQQALVAQHPRRHVFGEDLVRGDVLLCEELVREHGHRARHGHPRVVPSLNEGDEREVGSRELDEVGFFLGQGALGGGAEGGGAAAEGAEGERVARGDVRADAAPEHGPRGRPRRKHPLGARAGQEVRRLDHLRVERGGVEGVRDARGVAELHAAVGRGLARLVGHGLGADQDGAVPGLDEVCHRGGERLPAQALGLRRQEHQRVVHPPAPLAQDDLLRAAVPGHPHVDLAAVLGRVAPNHFQELRVRLEHALGLDQHQRVPRLPH